MKIFKQALPGVLALAALLMSACSVGEQANRREVPEGVFQVNNPDYELSPYTGVTRAHWKDAALYLLEGAFSHLDSMSGPMRFPRQPGKSYPQDGQYNVTENLEGLCRTLFMAAPLLREDPELEVKGYPVAEYYRGQILQLIDAESPMYVKHMTKPGWPSQTLVEFGALAISLSVAPEVLWAPLSQEEKDALAALMISYGNGPTVASNWRFFNIFVLSFFKEQGYEVDEPLMREYIEKSLAQYRGEGWYNDSPAYDFYSMWAFQMYGKIWSELYGKRLYPEYASRFEANFADLTDNYPYLFDANGEMIMWGRSIAYRFAAAVPFPLMGWEAREDVNYGWMRRIASSTMLQFLQHPEMLQDEVPTLGFYGAFEPSVQIYSCRASVYWMGKLFMGLLVPEDSPFWTAEENNGAWDNELEKGAVYNKFQPGSELLITNYPNIGASEVRSWCHERVADDWQKFRSTENYNRLAYNTAFHWQADGDQGEVAMNYLFKNAREDWEAFRLYTFKRFEDEVYYRDVVLETDAELAMNLADIPLANGILRVDRQLSPKAVAMRLGHYALPDLGAGIKEEVRQVGDYQATIIDNGTYQLALVPLSGWTEVEVVAAQGLHPISSDSKVVVAQANYDPSTAETPVFATLMLWKKSGEQWSKADLLPVSGLDYQAQQNAVKVSLHKGADKLVRFE